MHETPTTKQVLAVRQRRKVKTGGSGCAALGFFMVGLLMIAIGLLFFLPLGILGLLVFVVAFAVDAKHGYIYFCGHCGNDVAPTSQLCPICRAQLVEDKKGWFGF